MMYLLPFSNMSERALAVLWFGVSFWEQEKGSLLTVSVSAWLDWTLDARPSISFIRSSISRTM